MKIFKKPFGILICLCLALTMISTALATDNTNLSMNVSAESVNIGETVTVKLSTDAMTVSSFTCGVQFDNTKFECTSFVGSDEDYPTYIFINKVSGKTTEEYFNVGTVADANSTGYVGFGIAGTADTEYVACADFVTITFTAKAAGDADFVLYEDSAGTNDHKTDAADTQTVTVLNPATSITLNKETTSIEIGGTETLGYSINPTDTTDTVEWSSKDDDIATVDKSTGKVTGVAAGTVTITATAGTVSDTCEVIVTKKKSRCFGTYNN